MFSEREARNRLSGQRRFKQKIVCCSDLFLKLVTFPREFRGIELHHVVVDGGAGGDELGPHGHEETVEGVYGLFALDLDFATVESSTELDLLIPIKPQIVRNVSNISVGTDQSIEHQYGETSSYQKDKKNLSSKI